MDVSLHANMCDSETSRISQALHQPLRAIGKDISGDYGGAMEHLWIDFELNRPHVELRKAWPFRFQKRVSGANRLVGINGPGYCNVGHYSVCPDFDYLLSLSTELSVGYAVGLIYASTTILSGKVKRLGGFNVTKFRERFASVCMQHGYIVASAR